MERAERLKRSQQMPRGINIDHKHRYRVRVFYDGKQHDLGAYHDEDVARAILKQARIDMATGVFVPRAERRRQMRARRLAAEAAAAAAAELIDPNQEQLPGV